jgi:hypothetical protein
MSVTQGEPALCEAATKPLQNVKKINYSPKQLTSSVDSHHQFSSPLVIIEINAELGKQTHLNSYQNLRESEEGTEGMRQ